MITKVDPGEKEKQRYRKIPTGKKIAVKNKFLSKLVNKFTKV